MFHEMILVCSLVSQYLSNKQHVLIRIFLDMSDKKVPETLKPRVLVDDTNDGIGFMTVPSPRDKMCHHCKTIMKERRCFCKRNSEPSKTPSGSTQT